MTDLNHAFVLMYSPFYEIQTDNHTVWLVLLPKQNIVFISEVNYIEQGEIVSKNRHDEIPT